jgi:hypothetical protein
MYSSVSQKTFSNQAYRVAFLMEYSTILKQNINTKLSNLNLDPEKYRTQRNTSIYSKPSKIPDKIVFYK